MSDPATPPSDAEPVGHTEFITALKSRVGAAQFRTTRIVDTEPLRPEFVQQAVGLPSATERQAVITDEIARIDS
ncbi:hypothetical protein ACFT2C_00915 [Promicromonospora sp. NPDC057138]|uniref:hypothetical protein n=1 Tax=Promicromonospora sp. NPDC057138 TaxID=3346031 RepID=UPI003645C2C8